MSKKRFFIAGFVIIVLAAVVVGAALWFRVAVPRLITERVNAYLSDVGTVGDVDVNFLGEVVLRDVEVPPAPGRRLSGRADVVRVRLSMLSLLVGAFDEAAVKHIDVNGFELVVHVPAKESGVVTGKPGGRARTAELTKDNRVPNYVISNSSRVIYARPPGFPGAPTVTRAKSPPADLEEEYEAAVPTAPPEDRAITPQDLEVAVGKEYRFDCGFSARDGEFHLERSGDRFVLATDITCDGTINGGVLAFDLTAEPADGASFQAEGEVAVDGSSGAAKYSARGLTVPFLLNAFGRPKWLASASGRVEMWGTYAWAPGYKPRHEADGRIEDGEVEMATKRLTTKLTDVDAEFRVETDRLEVPSGGRFTAVGARWWVDGIMSKEYIDLSFKSERMSLQNVVDMVVGAGVVRYPGEGYATIRFAGVPDDPAMYVKVRR